MPSSPKIPKDMILKAALELLIEQGYGNVTIKSVAEKFNCSTQPVSWHFGNMEGFRKALAEYALHYANGKMLSASEGMSAFSKAGTGYLDIAVDEPNLFRYLYMSDEGRCYTGGFDILTTAGKNAEMVKQIARQSGASAEKVSVFFRDIIIYTHGLACFAASGLIKAAKEELYEMVRQRASEYMQQAGIGKERENDGENK